MKITSIGDVCVDVYTKENQFFLGGTAFNRARWLAQNGARVSLVSAIGTDDWGKQYLAACKKLGININYLTVLPGKTSHIEITLDQNQSPEFSEWDLGVLKNFYPQKWPENQDALITTGLKPIKQLLDWPAGSFRVADFDGQTPYTFSEADINKFAPRFDLVISSTVRKISHPMVLLTMGAGGSRLITPSKQYFAPAQKIKTQDTTGAGDVYISSFVINYLTTKNIPLAMRRANRDAAQAITLPKSLSV